MEAIYYKCKYENLELNESLYNTVKSNLSIQPVIGGGFMTPNWNFHKLGLKNVNSICDWIMMNTLSAAVQITTRYDEESPKDFSLSSFEIVSCWGIHYTHNTHIVMHNHFPFAMGFVYCVRCPEGGSPLVIEDEHIDLEEGEAAIFLAHQYHGTIPTNTTDRCMIVGNIAYKFWEWKGF